MHFCIYYDMVTIDIISGQVEKWDFVNVLLTYTGRGFEENRAAKCTFAEKVDRY